MYSIEAIKTKNINDIIDYLTTSVVCHTFYIHSANSCNGLHILAASNSKTTGVSHF